MGMLVRHQQLQRLLHIFPSQRCFPFRCVLGHERIIAFYRASLREPAEYHHACEFSTRILHPAARRDTKMQAFTSSSTVTAFRNGFDFVLSRTDLEEVEVLHARDMACGQFLTKTA